MQCIPDLSYLKRQKMKHRNRKDQNHHEVQYTEIERNKARIDSKYFKVLKILTTCTLVFEYSRRYLSPS